MLHSYLARVSLVLLLVPLVAATPERDTVTVPRGYRTVLLDGRVDRTEWEDAKIFDVTPKLRLFLKRDSAYLYVAVLPAEPRLFGVNLYLASTDTLAPYLNLHASAKLAERTGTRTTFPEWQWWNNAGWAGNVTRFNAFDGQRFLPEVAKELQIALARLPGGTFRLSLDIEDPTGTEQPISSGTVADGLHWYSFRVSP